MTSEATRMPVAVIGAGAIGRTHLERLLSHPDVAPAAVADPAPASRDYAASIGVPWFADYRDLLERTPLGAVIVATPNHTHAEGGIACIERRLPVLMEKPVTDTVAQGRLLCEAAAAANVPLMVGHQRRHNPILRSARALLADGVVGRPVSVTAMATWLKPDSYFAPAWRRQ